MKLTNQQQSTLQLIMRSPDIGGGWRTCSSVVFQKLVIPMPDELFEKDVEREMVRLTEKGLTLVEWL